MNCTWAVCKSLFYMLGMFKVGKMLSPEQDAEGKS